MSNGEKIPRAKAEAVGESVIDTIMEQVSHALICGSIRRGLGMVGDCDIVAVAHDETAAEETMRIFTGLGEKLRAGAGKKRASIRVEGVQVDLWLVPRESWGAAIMFATGSAQLNIRQRQLARRQGMILTQYGLFRDEAYQDRVAGDTEEGVYEALGLAFLEPEQRSYP